MSETLKPCPFCGSDKIDPTGWSSVDTQGPSCDNCGACAGESNKSPEENIAAWNTRPQRLAMVDVLKAVVDCLDPNKDDGYRAEDPGGAMDTAFAQARKVLHEAGEQ